MPIEFNYPGTPKYALYLDDCRNPLGSVTINVGTPLDPVQMETLPWAVPRSYDEFVQVLTERGMPAFISFDHDLDEEHMKEYFAMKDNGDVIIDYDKFEVKTGLDCCKYMVDMALSMNQIPAAINLHTHNSYGLKNMKEYLKSVLPRVRITTDRLPFEWVPELLPASLK